MGFSHGCDVVEVDGSRPSELMSADELHDLRQNVSDVCDKLSDVLVGSASAVIEQAFSELHMPVAHHDLAIDCARRSVDVDFPLLQGPLQRHFVLPASCYSPSSHSANSVEGGRLGGLHVKKPAEGRGRCRGKLGNRC